MIYSFRLVRFMMFSTGDLHEDSIIPMHTKDPQGI
jgi:hypothetical protein